MERWKKNLWILWTTQIISLASFGFGLPFIPLYIQDLEVMSPERIKLMTTILAVAPAITMGIMAPIWGHLADKYGRKLMIIRAMTFAIFIIGGMGFVSNVNQLIVLRLMQGLFTGTVTAAIAFVGSNTPKSELTYGLGVISSSTFIGFSAGPLIGGGFAELFGYRASFIVGGVLMAIGAFLVLVLVKEDKSTLMPKTSTEHVSIVQKYKKIIGPTIVLIMGMLFLLRISRTLFSPYLSLLIQNKFETKEGVASTTGLIIALSGFSTAFSSIIIAKISKRFNKLKLLTNLLIVGMITMIILTQYERINDVIGHYISFVEHSELVIFTAIYMVFFFVVGGVEPLLTSSAALAVEPANRGALFGLQGLIGSLAWFVAPMIAGPIAYFYDVELVLWVVPVVIGLNVIMSTFVRKLNQSV